MTSAAGKGRLQSIAPAPTQDEIRASFERALEAQRQRRIEEEAASQERMGGKRRKKAGQSDKRLAKYGVKGLLRDLNV